jgi:fructose-bisphosphate aldolase class II
MAPWDPTSNKTYQILKAAEEGGYGVQAPIAYNIEHILAFVRAAEAKRSPLIIQVFPWAITFSDGLLIHAAAHAARHATVPVAIHLDHAQDEAMIRLAADTLPFDSIMVDMSHYEMDENLAKTQTLVKYCHDRGISTEAEPGRIEGGEDGVAETADLEGVLTTPDEAELFVNTGIDMLAPAFGNVHGEYGPRGIRLEYDRLQSINERVGERVRLVLHGADPFNEEIFRNCMKGGVTKININKGMNNHYAWKQEEMRGKPLTSVIEAGTLAMQKAIENYMHWFGSAGKA